MRLSYLFILRMLSRPRMPDHLSRDSLPWIFIPFVLFFFPKHRRRWRGSPGGHSSLAWRSGCVTRPCDHYLFLFLFWIFCIFTFICNVFFLSFLRDGRPFETICIFLFRCRAKSQDGDGKTAARSDTYKLQARNVWSCCDFSTWFLSLDIGKQRGSE